MSCLVKTDWNCQFSIQALAALGLYRIYPPGSGADTGFGGGGCQEILLMTICGAKRHSRRLWRLRGKVRRGGLLGPLSVGGGGGGLKIKCSRCDSEGT